MWRLFKGDFLIYAGAKVLVGLSSFVLLRFLTTAMPPAEYANYALIFAIITFVTTVFTSWQTNSAVRFLPVAIEREKKNSFDQAFLQISIFSTLCVTAAAAVALTIAVWVNFIQLSGTAFTASLVAASAGSAFQLYSIYGYSARQRRLYSLLLVLQISFFMLGAAFIPYIGANPVNLSIIFLAASFIIPLILFRMPWPSLTLRLTRNTRKLSMKFFRYGAPIAILNIAIQLNTYLDQFMLRAMTDLREVGLYAANYVVADKVIYALASVTSIALGPLIYREWERGRKAASYQMIWKASAVFLIICSPVMIIMLTIPEVVMSFLTKPEYAAGQVIIPYVMFAALFSGTASLINFVHTLLLRTKELALIYLAGTLLNFILNLIFIPRFGLIGCAYSTALSFSSIFVIIIIRAYQLCGFISYLPGALKSLCEIRIFSAKGD